MLVDFELMITIMMKAVDTVSYTRALATSQRAVSKSRYIDANEPAFPEPYPLQKRSLSVKNKTWREEILKIWDNIRLFTMLVA